jgi:hypothetical protein
MTPNKKTDITIYSTATASGPRKLVFAEQSHALFCDMFDCYEIVLTAKASKVWIELRDKDCNVFLNLIVEREKGKLRIYIRNCVKFNYDKVQNCEKITLTREVRSTVIDFVFAVDKIYNYFFSF